MGLFSLDNILLENNNTSIDIDNIGYVDKAVEKYSFVQEGYNAILEMNAFYCNAEKDFYTKVMGSYGDSVIINESFSDFFNKIKDIIKKFIDWVKKIFKEFVAKLAGLVGSEKYIKKNAKLLNKFSSEDEFEFQGYKFTNLETYNDIPAAKAKDAFTSTAGDTTHPNVGVNYLSFEDYFKNSDGEYYNFSDDKYNDMIDSKLDANAAKAEIDRRKEATDKINAELSKRIEQVSDKNEDFYEEFRGIVINKANEKFDSREFTEELFKIFRDDSSSASSITIDSNFVNDSYRRFDKYKDTIKAIEKNKNDMIKDYEDLEKYLDKMIKYNKDTYKLDLNIKGSRTYTDTNLGKIGFGAADNGIIYNSSTADRMQSLLKVYSARVNQMCQIHTQAFSAKLEAAKDCFKQDKQILNKAIQKILKRSNKEGF